MRQFLALLSLVWLGIAGTAHAQPQFPERGTAPVVDAANVIDPAVEAVLTEKLDAFEQRSQRQFVVATIPDLEDYDIADYGYQLGRHWGIGQSEINNGIILIVAPNDRKVRIEVGYGLESIIPDGLAYDIIESMTPRFKEGDYGGGITLGADAIIRQLELPPEEAQAIAQQVSQRQEEDQGFPFGFLIWLAFIGFFFILPAIARGGRRYRGGGGVGNAVGNVLLWTAVNAAMSSGRGGGGGGWSGGGGGGGGGFSGGGGSFGGGGASGGW